jgi:hypothetical protein
VRSALKKIVVLYPRPPSASQTANDRELVRRSGNRKKVNIVKKDPAMLSVTDTYTSGLDAIGMLIRMTRRMKSVCQQTAADTQPIK